MAEIADGIDNVEADGSFVCTHGILNVGGNAHWVADRWERGTKPAEQYVSFYCENQHHNEVLAETYDSPCDPPTKCRGTHYGATGNVPCESVTFMRSGGGSRGPNSGTWPYDTIIPRTCSFCGGVHPEDLIELTKLGFRPERTDKGYKYYVNGPDGSGLTPPVKFYTNHANKELFAKLNAAIGA